LNFTSPVILRFRLMDNRLWIPPVKVFLVLLVCALSARAAPNDPGAVAIDFLEKVRMGKLNLNPGGDTALSPHTADSKKRKIARSIERMARDLGSDPLEVGAVKLDEGFAAVIVRKVGGFDPGRLQVFPVALIKRGAEWFPAPVPASFENSGAGYALDLRHRLERLENWMLREQVTDLEQLREKSAARMREKIETTLQADEVRTMDATQCAQRFLAACVKHDLPAMLGLLGGLAGNLPDDWSLRLKAAERTVAAGAGVPRPWRLLASPEIARAIVGNDQDGADAFISIACLDPAGTGSTPPAVEVELVHIEIMRTDDGLWQVNLPQPFLERSGDMDAIHDDGNQEGDFDADLMDAFPAAWIKDNPLKPEPDAGQARQALVEALGSGRLAALLAIAKIDAESGESARRTCIEAAEIGWRIQNPNAVGHAMPLSFTQGETTAAAVFQFFSARDPDLFDPRTLYFEKTEAGWLWSPTPSAATRDAYETWAASEYRRWKNQWQESLLAGITPQAGLESLAAPSKEESRLVVENWLRDSRLGDIRTILKHVTRLDHPKSNSTLLQNLGYEIAGIRRSSGVPVVTGVYQGNTWTAVGVRIESGGRTSHPLYALLQTPQGPRILIETDLFASGNRSREFLNRAALERLRASTPTADELRDLHREHQTHVESLPSR
jgi:hypothetical protein